MRYASILREVQFRLEYHSRATLLTGLKIKKAGEFRIEGTVDLPQLCMIDLEAAEQPGRASAQLTMFLKTKRKDDWFKLTDEGPNGLIDWMERVMDAVETKPSDGTPDGFLFAHNLDGTQLLVTGNPIQLLPNEISWTAKMAEVTDLSFTMQLDMVFTQTLTRRATRRTRPLAPVSGP